MDFKVRRSGLGVVVFTPHKGEDGGEEAGHHFEGGQVSASCLGGAARWGGRSGHLGRGRQARQSRAHRIGKVG